MSNLPISFRELFDALSNCMFDTPDDIIGNIELEETEEEGESEIGEIEELW